MIRLSSVRGKNESKMKRDNSGLDYHDSSKDGENYMGSGIYFEGKLTKLVRLDIND